jgi:predicted nucleotidyltransferase
MSSESPQHSIRPDSPLDPSIVCVLRALDPIARNAGCAYFVAGATARDIMLANIHGLRPGRATRDIDFGVTVEDWNRFAALKESMTATGRFVPDRRALQRMTYVDRAAGFSIPVDLIPFGGVASAGAIEWPPNRDTVMNVSGFEEALAAAVPIEFEPQLKVRVASLPGLMLLKLIAWSDRGLETGKDAVDMQRLLTSYADAGNTDRIYNQEMELLEAHGYDMELAGAELLGRDVADLCSPAALAIVRSVLESGQSVDRLVSQIVRASGFVDVQPSVERQLDSFRRGVLNRRRR